MWNLVNSHMRCGPSITPASLVPRTVGTSTCSSLPPPSSSDDLPSCTSAFPVRRRACEPDVAGQSWAGLGCSHRNTQSPDHRENQKKDHDDDDDRPNAHVLTSWSVYVLQAVVSSLVLVFAVTRHAGDGEDLLTLLTGPRRGGVRASGLSLRIQVGRSGLL